MTTMETVLVGTDGSQPALAAVRWAAKEAERRHAELRVGHAFDERWAAAPALRGEGVFEMARNHAEEIVADSELIAHAAAPGVTVRRDADIGDPVDVLV
jgi:nucleotide-binding universal stress UspA family protein